MPRFTFLLTTVLALGLTLAAQTPGVNGNTKSVEKPFVSGGNIQMRLQAGDYQIKAGSTDRIVVSWSGSRAEDAHAQVRVSGSQAWIETQTPDNNGPHFTIEVPSRSNLQVRLTAGALGVAPLKGDLDLELQAGDLRIDVDDPQLFSSVAASTSVGDLSSGPFHADEKGWLGRSIRWAGGGKYRLQAHVGTGDLTISTAQSKPE